MTIGLIELVLFGLLPLALLVTGFRRPSYTTLALFSDTYAVPITSENRSVVERYIRGSRSMRMVGVLIALGVMAAVRRATGTDVNLTFYVAMGYGLGAVTYELARRAPGPGSAALAPRRIDDYVQPLFARLLYLTSAVGAAVYGLWFVFDIRTDQSPTIDVVAYPATRGFALGGLALAALAAQRIVRAPQPVISPAIDAAQHAIRTSALLSLVGLALMAGGILAVGGSDLGRSTAPGWLGDLASLIGVTLAFVGSIVGFFLTVRSLPRYAPFWRRLPAIAPTTRPP